MKGILTTGIALVVIGAAVLSYGRYGYATRENILQIGPITATAEETHTASPASILGWLLIGGGACVLAFAALSKKN